MLPLFPLFIVFRLFSKLTFTGRFQGKGIYTYVIVMALVLADLFVRIAHSILSCATQNGKIAIPFQLLLVIIMALFPLCLTQSDSDSMD
jgi:hypothetical protein